MSRLTAAGMLYSSSSASATSHAWATGWMSTAMAALYQESIKLPPGI